MRKFTLLCSAAITFVVVVAFASGAGAATADIDPGGSIAATSNGRITFGSGITIACPLTLSGTLATRVAVEEGANLGAISRVAIGTCEGGSVSGVLALPWQMTIAEVLGSDMQDLGDIGDLRDADDDGDPIDDGDGTDGRTDLDMIDDRYPDFKDIRGLLLQLQRVAFNFSVFGMNCLYQGALGALLQLNGDGDGNYDTGNLVVLGGMQLPLVSGGFLCPREGPVRGEFRVTAQDIVVTP